MCEIEENKSDTGKKAPEVEEIIQGSEETSCPDDKKKNKKKNKKEFFKGFIVGAVVLLFAAVLYKGYIMIKLPSGAILSINLPTYYLFEKQEVNGINEREVSKKLHEMNLLLDDYFFYDADKKNLTEGICSGMMYGVYTKDPYAAYFTNEGYKEEKKENAGEYIGIGVTVQLLPDKKGVRIVEVKEGSPALEAGIKPEDIIIAVDGEDIRELDLDTVVNKKVLGKPGTKVKLKLQRGEEELELECERRNIITKTVTYKMLDGYKLGYIKINSFGGVTEAQFDDALGNLENEGAKGVIIDVRDNPGGDMNVTLAMLDLILEDKLDAYTNGDEDWYEKGKTMLLCLENKKKERTAYQSRGGFSYDLPVVVLANGNSASASEIFAGTLKCYGYPVVGEKTFGKGIVQATYQLADGSAMKFTVEQYLLPNGDEVHGKGVEPDYKVTNTEEGVDAQLEKAIDVLWGEILNGDE